MDALKIKEFKEKLNYCLPYTEKDLDEAIKLGYNLALAEIKSKMVGMSVNGVIQTVLTKEKLEEINVNKI